MIIIVMGVAGSGKTTIGKLLAEQLGWRFVEGDDFHSEQNVQKMSRGIPLDDSDRADWLRSLNQSITRWAAEGQNLVLSCSALKEKYRHQLVLGTTAGAVLFVYAKISYELSNQRLAERKDHFMPASLLASQFETLEEPQEAITVDAGKPPEQLVQEIRLAISL